MSTTAYLFSSSALFFSSSLVAGVGRLSACTGPCLPVSLHPVYQSASASEVRTGFALWASAETFPPLVALVSTSLLCVSRHRSAWLALYVIDSLERVRGGVRVGRLLGYLVGDAWVGVSAVCCGE
jgi:hypothetical protein